MTACIRVVVAFLVVFLAGCAGRGEVPVAGPPVHAGGIEVSAVANAWRGWPSELGRIVTPIRVRLVNQGSDAVRVDVTKFALVLPDGGRLAAMLPGDVKAVVVEPPPAALPQAGLALGPTRDRSGPGWALNDPGPDLRLDPTLEPDRTWQLPSADMLDQALPEGALAPGQAVSGFVYFQRTPRETRDVTLTWPVVDTAGAEVGVAAVPLTLR
jgi:hypothetical protein